MAKRYKKNKNKKIVRNFIFIFIVCIVIVIGICIYVNFYPKEDSNERIGEVTAALSQIETLSSDLLVPKELNEEIVTKLNSKGENWYLVKIHYQLTSLEEGTITLYYNVEQKEVIEIKVNIQNKEIENVSRYENQDLYKKIELRDNMKEDIRKKFEENKEKLTEKTQLNIIITDTEILTNLSYI